MTQSPAGWYPDPYGTPQLRWWDGSQWTDATHPLEVVAAQNAQVGTQAGSGIHGGASPGATGGDSLGESLGLSSGPSSGPNSGPHSRPQTGTAVEDPPKAPESADESSAAPGSKDTTHPDASGTPDGAASGTTGPGTGATEAADATASPAPARPDFAPAATADASPTAVTAQWSSPGGAVPGVPAAAAWAGPGGPSQRGDTAQLPVPDFPPPRQGRPMLPWIAGGVAAAVVIVLLVVGTIYLTASRGGPGDQRDLASSPTANTESSPPAPEPTQGTTEPPQPPSAGRITDRVSGLSYSYPGAPWQLIEAGQIDSSDPGGQQWSSGFQTLSQDDYEPGKDWFGSVLAGPLADDAPYSGPQSMRDIAATFLLNNEGSLYEPPHERRIVADKAITVSGRPGWLLRFEMDFSKQSKANGWKWQKELGAVVLVDRGEANPPALLFATVPDNLDTGVIDQVISSLRVE
ncbi:DUF2510 domain-containing protein [Thermopolyspora sp. NPDC052614]|uniref:DUF2510 domain-containing protein n=1 Tax=Thermopolyspora sp. NPDC052614 TaxID=3155682 RepID=UPI003439761C